MSKRANKTFHYKFLLTLVLIINSTIYVSCDAHPITDFETCYSANTCDDSVPMIDMNKDRCDTYIAGFHETIEGGGNHNIGYKLFGDDKTGFNSFTTPGGLTGNDYTSIVKFNTNHKYTIIREATDNSGFTPAPYPDTTALLRYTSFIPDSKGDVFNNLNYVMSSIVLNAANCEVKASITYYSSSSEATSVYDAITDSDFKRLYIASSQVITDKEKVNAGYSVTTLIKLILTDNWFCSFE